MSPEFSRNILMVSRFMVVFFVSVLGAVKEGYGQRVYANGYGADESGVAIPFLIAAGRVINPTNGIEPNSTSVNYVELRIGGLLGSAYANYQIEFANREGNLPAGTSVYVRLEDNTTDGILGLALATQGFVSVYSNANSNNTQTTKIPATLTGSSVSLEDNEVVALFIDGQQYLRITPTSCFNAIRFSIASDGILGLLTAGNIRIYHAYYEYPETIIVANQSICPNESTTLQVENPISETGCDYRWYNQPTGGTLLGTGPSLTTPSLQSTATYYVGYSGIDPTLNPSEYSRTPVTVTVNPLPEITLLPITPICEGGFVASLGYSNPLNDPDRYSIRWNGGVPSGFTNVTNAVLPDSPITLPVPVTAAMGTYTGTLTVKNNSTGCESGVIVFTVQVLPQPGKPHLTITDVQN